jgi:uncharacterized membrane protein YfcA
MFSTITVIIIAASSLTTSFISGILGMSGGMILMGILLSMLPLRATMMMHGISQLSSNGWRAFMLRDQINWRVMRGYVLGLALALTLFIVLRLVVSKGVAMILMGLLPFVALALPERLHLNVERRGHSFVCGLVCNVISLTAGIAGPILDVFFVRSKMTRHRVIATKAMTQTLSHLTKVFYFGSVLSLQGIPIGPGLVIMLVALSFIGTSLSRSVLERMTDESFRQWSRWAVRVLGIVYFVSGVVMLKS